MVTTSQGLKQQQLDVCNWTTYREPPIIPQKTSKHRTCQNLVSKEEEDMSDRGKDVEQGNATTSSPVASPSTSPAQPSYLTRRSFISNLFRLSKTSADPPPPPRPDPAKLAARRVDASARSGSASTGRRGPPTSELGTSVRSTGTADIAGLHPNNPYVQRSAKSTGSFDLQGPAPPMGPPGTRLGVSVNESQQIDRSAGSFTMSGLMRNSVALFGRTSADPHQVTLSSMVGGGWWGCV